MREPLTRHQPFKSLYVGYLVVFIIFVRLPWWTLKFLPRRNRPRPTWSLLRCLIVIGYREVLTSLATKLGLSTTRDPPASDDALKDAKLVWIEPLDEDSPVFCGEIRRAAGITNVSSARVPAYWNLKPGTVISNPVMGKAGERTALHIHGGAFHLGSAHPDAPPSNLSQGLLLHSTTMEKVLAVDYRLSAAWPDRPANPFPAALLDSLAAYSYLVNEAGFEAKNITVIGDSAGGNLAFALVRHLVENPIPGLPPPGRLLSCSAWLDLTASRNGPESSLVRNRRSDILGFGSEYPRNSYLGPLPAEEARTNRYLSPVSAYFAETEGLFKGFPRTFVSAGEAELILDDSLVVADMMKKDDVEVVLDVVPDAIHDFSIFPWHEPERTAALKTFSGWMDK